MWLSIDNQTCFYHLQSFKWVGLYVLMAAILYSCWCHMRRSPENPTGRPVSWSFASMETTTRKTQFRTSSWSSWGVCPKRHDCMWWLRDQPLKLDSQKDVWYICCGKSSDGGHGINGQWFRRNHLNASVFLHATVSVRSRRGSNVWDPSSRVAEHSEHNDSANKKDTYKFTLRHGCT